MLKLQEMPSEKLQYFRQLRVFNEEVADFDIDRHEMKPYYIKERKGQLTSLSLKLLWIHGNFLSAFTTLIVHKNSGDLIGLLLPALSYSGQYRDDDFCNDR